jgi:putative radical SAM enzyme (TIGR03279 family)
LIRVATVSPGSIADELGLEPGTEVLSVNGVELDDFLDWEFHSAEEELALQIRQPDGTEVAFEIDRDLDDPLGLTFEPPRIRRCANRCDFCFVDGNPIGLREVLYIRDDDYRLSFRYGNFATLTNLKPRDVDRIISYRLSPLYVSVHATDPSIRRHLLRNPTAPEILPQLRQLAGHGIQFHTQIVLSPGVNDGPILDQSLSDLYHFGPEILSVSVVPVGLTEYSKHGRCREPTAADCRAAIDTVKQWSGRARAERQRGWVYGADELYLRANRPLPGETEYDDFEQVENGVGAVRYLQRTIAATATAFTKWRDRRIGVVTGLSMGGLMPQNLEPLRDLSGATFELIITGNSVFGPRVTTAGLLPGRDIEERLSQQAPLDLVLLPGEALNDDGLFIDGMPAAELVGRSRAPIRFSKNFADALDD